jgi:mRNA interferase RelE/StbE
MNLIKWTPKATKQVRKLDKQHARQVVVAVGELTNMPACQNVKALTNHEYQYRLRVGNYRVFFNFDGAVRIVSIEEVKKRDERTY